ncbi:A/G-specific adenine glycosylase [Nitrosomonas sp. wSCUT-2]
MSFLAESLIRWHPLNGRHDLPWQQNRNPYAIWISEIMLQQTQVSTVIPYYQRFLQTFPAVDRLANAPLDDVLALWSGLGYYSRARNLHLAAHRIVHEYQGQFPELRELIQQLPGVGRSTAAAIAVFAFGQREAILDGNVKRIFARFFGIEGHPGQSKIQKLLWQKAEAALPDDHRGGSIETYTQALMDLGSTVCTRDKPQCGSCPLQSKCIAWQQQRVMQLPAAKPRQPLPRKETVLLLLQHHQRLLLEKRPSDGIWGGLWCLPEMTMDMDIVNYCQQQWGISVQPPVELPALDHQFTHYKLRIYPQLLQVTPNNPAARPDCIWLTPLEALDYGIPAPVRALLKQNFLTGQSSFSPCSEYHG